MCARIHQAFLDKAAGVLLNAGAWTHSQLWDTRRTRDPDGAHSRDPHVERPRARSAHISVFAEVVNGSICGFGVDSYLLGLRAAVSAAGGSKKKK